MKFLLCYMAIFCVFFTSCTARSGLNERDVMIDAGDILLGATLTFPEGAREEPLPAMVIAHGSSPTTRNDVGFYKAMALGMGFAVLTFDKRGVGESTGTFELFSVVTSEHTINKLSDDVAYAVRWLAGQPGIDATQIGLFGGSQAGWVMPMAAKKEALVSFVIIGEGVPVSAGEEHAHGQVIQLLRGSEFSADITSVDGAKADAALLAYEGPAGYDPASMLQDYDTPTLWFFGLRDYVIPVGASLDRLEVLISSGKTNHAVHVFPFGDHNFLNVATGERYMLTPVIERWFGILNKPKRAMSNQLYDE